MHNYFEILIGLLHDDELLRLRRRLQKAGYPLIADKLTERLEQLEAEERAKATK